ncbi:uncharacterized protein LOC131169101 [Hevea brasiliensis]|uniref:uncharacterized protein LOC131169101 n=1 Tax=Hevea brasiliensis TaxID=3981 RepID=UPI0025E2CC9D|nr:uncharacterized protein LOC131169101 [Hevea brasiliensis]
MNLHNYLVVFNYLMVFLESLLNFFNLLFLCSSPKTPIDLAIDFILHDFEMAELATLLALKEPTAFSAILTFTDTHGECIPWFKCPDCNVDQWGIETNRVSIENGQGMQWRQWICPHGDAAKP